MYCPDCCDVEMEESVDGDTIVYTCLCCGTELAQPTSEFGMRVVDEEELFNG